MSAAGLSGHLVTAYTSGKQTAVIPPYSADIATLDIESYGPMSFAPIMHGSFNSQPSFLMDQRQQSVSEATAIQIATLQAKLNKKLGPEYVSQRPGPGGAGKLTYAEGWKMINLANEVFGFNGWSSNVVSLTTDFIDFNEESRRYNVGVTAIMRVTLRDGVYHEDIGYGSLENSKSKGAALDKCKKEAVTDGIKRCFRNLGNLLGNCLYDKTYTTEIVKIKVPPAKFDKSELHRRAEFADPPPPQESNNHNASSAVITTTSRVPAPATSSSTTVAVVAAKPHTSIPAHMRAGTTNAATPANDSKRNVPGGGSPLAAMSIGLKTPITTPAQAMRVIPTKQQPHTRNVAFAQPNNDKVTSRPQQQPPREEQASSVTASDETTAEPDYFQSDDDALFCQVADGGDMFLATVEGDLGQPIDYEEGTRASVDEDEEDSGMTVEEEAEAGSANRAEVVVDPGEYERRRERYQQQNQNQNQNRGQHQQVAASSSSRPVQPQPQHHQQQVKEETRPTSRNQNQQQQNRPLQQQQAGSSSSSSTSRGTANTGGTRNQPQMANTTGSSLRNPQQQQQQSANRVAFTVGSGGNGGSGAAKNPHTANRPSHHNNNGTTGASIHTPNPNPNNVNTKRPIATSATPPSSSSSSAMGGFHFPPGHAHPKPGPPVLGPAGGGSGQYVTGQKRGVDAMNGSVQQPISRRPAQGMGLSHNHNQNQRREPLGALHVAPPPPDGGGDLKRVKR